jgi:hypothetical protein
VTGHPWSYESVGLDPASNAQPGDSFRIVELIVGQRHEDLGDARCQSLRRGPDASVMDERFRPRQKHVERHVPKVDNGIWQAVGNLLREFR